MCNGISLIYFPLSLCLMMVSIVSYASLHLMMFKYFIHFSRLFDFILLNLRLFYILDKSLSSDIWFAIILLVCNACFFILSWREVSNFDEVYFIKFFFLRCIFSIVSKIFLYNLNSQRFSPMISFRNFVIWNLKCRPMINFELSLHMVVQDMDWSPSI